MAALDWSLMEWVRARATDSLDVSDVSEVTLRVERIVERPRAQLTWLDATGGGRCLPMLVKQLIGPANAETGPNRVGRSGERRPRIATPGTYAERYLLEFEALAATMDLFESADSRLAAVPVLGYLPEQHALLMERLDGPSLRDLLRPRPPLVTRVHPEPMIGLAGRWLRHYHDAPSDGLRTRHTRSDDVTDLARRLCSFLGENLGSQKWFRRTDARLARLIEGWLPDRLPLVLAHGDFAPRNVLVLRGQRVTALDMAGGSAIPRYEDVAYFLASVRTSGARVLSQGIVPPEGVVRQWERAFIDGYFATSEAPWAAIRVYEVLVILDKWWGTPPRLATDLRTRLAAATLGRLVDRFFRDEIERLLDLAEAETGLPAKSATWI